MNETQQAIQKLIDAGMSQANIARATGIPQSRLSRWAAGEVPDSACFALAISRLAAKVAKGKK
ncbi:MAG: helix-turn-helix transcriptional regulator [Georgfuchsia sp.]